MIKSLAHVCILSRNLDRTLDFYCSTLGLEKGFDFLRDGELFGFYLKITGRQFLEVFQTGECRAAGLWPPAPGNQESYYYLKRSKI